MAAEQTQSLRSSTRVAIMASLLLAVVVVFAALVYTTRANIVASEMRAAAEQAERLHAAAMLELDDLDHQVTEWAASDLPAMLASASSTGFARREAEYLFSQADVAAVWVIGPRGTSYSWARGPVPSLPYWPAGSRLFVVDSGRLYVVVSKEVALPGSADDSKVTAVVARQADVAKLASFAGVDLGSLSVRGPGDPPPRRGALVRSRESSTAVELIRPHTLIIHSLLPSLSDKTALVTAEVESVGYQGAPQLVGGTVAALLIVGLMWGGATLNIIERFSLSRVTWLRSAVSALGERREAGVRLAVDAGARDEISDVADEINVMLERLEKARRSEHRAELISRALIDNMVDAVLVVDAAGSISFANSRAGLMVGCDPFELQGRHYSELFVLQAPDPLERLLSGRIAPDAIGIVETTLNQTGGDTLWLELSVSAFVRADRVEAIQLTARDVTERRRLQEELVWLADHDHLTGLFNRKRFEEEVERELAQAARTGAGGALLWLDLDGFKAINDVHGHRAGDEVLIRFAETLRESVRANHVVARIGGDEFAVLLNRADATEAECVAYRILEAVKSRVAEHEGQPLRVTASVGIALFPQDGTSLGELLSRADIAMYQAKESGKSTARRYSLDEDRERLLSGRQTWGAKIEEALASNRLVAFCQPIVDLATGEVARHELLVRLMDGDRVVLPGEFLAHAEELGLVNRIDSWMLDQALAIILESIETGGPTHLSLNLSGQAFSDSDFLESVYARLEAHREVRQYLGFEITETSLIRHMPVAADFTDKVKTMGCVVCLDDFGSGFSSFYYLRHLPVGVLKIDRELIRNVTRTKKDTRLVAGIAEMACGLGMKVVAEGVEDEPTAKLLRSFGVHMAQGELLGMPRAARDVLGQASGRIPVGVTDAG